jgi:hypothetical protein
MREQDSAQMKGCVLPSGQDHRVLVDTRPTKVVAFAEVPVVVACILLVFDSAALLFILLIYRYSPMDGLGLFLESASGSVCLFVAVLMAATPFGLAYHLRRLTPMCRRQAALAMAMNFITVAVLVLGGEGTIRLLLKIEAKPRSWTLNIPKLQSWERISERFRSAIDEHTSKPPYHEYDPMLGWTIGKSRRSSDGIYSSSIEGLRSPEPGIRLITWSQSVPVGVLAHPKPYRLALMGDSLPLASK